MPSCAGASGRLCIFSGLLGATHKGPPRSPVRLRGAPKGSESARQGFWGSLKMAPTGLRGGPQDEPQRRHAPYSGLRFFLGPSWGFSERPPQAARAPSGGVEGLGECATGPRTSVKGHQRGPRADFTRDPQRSTTYMQACVFPGPPEDSSEGPPRPPGRPWRAPRGSESARQGPERASRGPKEARGDASRPRVIFTVIRK